MESHPGLEFLRDAPDFHSRYIHTVSSVIISNVSQHCVFNMATTLSDWLKTAASHS